MIIITSILSLLKVLLLGTPATPEKSRILNRKIPKEEKRMYHKVRLQLWFERYGGYIMLIVFVFLILMFVLFIFWIVGASTLESGNVYNHMNDVI